MKNNISQLFTLVVFSILIIGFVAYKSGYFNKTKYEDLEDRRQKKLGYNSDTLADENEKNKLSIMPSSKVIILREYSKLNSDSAKKISLDFSGLDPMMFSTKAGIILKPEDFKEDTLDSMQIDSLN